MRNKFSPFVFFITYIFLAVSLSGCTVIFQKGRRVDVEKISKLKSELSDLERAKVELEERLKQEIKDKEVKVEMIKGNLVVTFVAEVLYDSGKADLKEGSTQKLDKVADVLNETVPNHDIGVEGHTDNQPIKYSGWKSNWELSSARALGVLHYLEDEKKLNPQRLSARAYGEHHPVESNDTPQGRQKNRRVEIVVLPQTEKKGR